MGVTLHAVETKCHGLFRQHEIAVTEFQKYQKSLKAGFKNLYLRPNL
jgi:hypothetical protein